MRLRGHHLLCILNFRGKGYSKEFVQNMAAISARLRSLEETVVCISSGPDDVCTFCPYLGVADCIKEGTASSVRLQDRLVLERLGIAPGDSLPWSEVKERMRRHVAPQDQERLCRRCSWLKSGLCSEGILQLSIGLR